MTRHFDDVDAAASVRPRAAGTYDALVARGERAAAPTTTSAFGRPLTSFVGRDDALAMVEALLDEHRLVTLTGSGGCGKTRLAVEVARRIEPSFADGGAFVDLAPIESGDLVASAVAAAAGVSEIGSEPLPALIGKALAGRHLLLVVDNCERVVEACAELLYGLLQECPRLVALTTSRLPMDVGGEVLWRVPSLSLPAEGATDPIAALQRSDAGQLLVDRARLVRPAFEPSAVDAAAMVTICRRLDGVPLAIELAASRLRALDPVELVAGLGDRFRLLRTGPRTAPPRQRALQASMDWSYDLLDDRERCLFRRLSVFAAAFILDSAVGVCASHDLPPHDVTALLASLVDQSLVQRLERGRFRMLETVREYAQDHLVAAGEQDRARDRHLDHVLTVAREFERGAEGADLEAANEQLEPWLDDIRSALEWSLSSGRIGDGMQLAADLRLFWVTRSRGHEGRRWFSALFERGDAARGRVVVCAQLAAAELHLEAGDPFTQAALAGEAVEGARALDDRLLEGRALVLSGWARMYTDPAGAKELLGQAQRLAEEVGDLQRVRSACFGLAVVEGTSGELESALALLDKGLAIERASSGFYLQWGLGTRGYVQTLRGQLGEALGDLRDATTWPSHRRYRTGGDLALTWLALALTYHGDYPEARARFDQAIAGSRAVGNPPAYALLHLAVLERALGAPHDATARLDEAGPVLQLLGTWFYVQALVCRADAVSGDDPATAEATRRDAMSLAKGSGNPLALCAAGLSCARGAVAEADHDRARRLARGALRAAVGCGYRIGAIDALEALAVLPGSDSTVLLAAVDAARAETGYVRFPADEAAYRAARGAGADAPGAEAALPFLEAAALATGGEHRPARPPAGWASLTPAELRVVQLVADGLTNPEIGERLFVSRRTVQAHLGHVFAKLGISNRSELAAEVSRRNATR